MNINNTIGVRFTGDAQGLLESLKAGGAGVDAFASKATTAGTMAAKGFEQGSMSAKAMAANMRGLPAQFTDIVVSLQGGQRPLTVLLQQGGQLKDMFGGIGPAARAMGAYVSGLVSPLTVAAVAAGGLALAYYQGSNEAREFNKSLILSGGIAGKTAGQLADMAAELKGSGYLQSTAAAAIAELAQSSGVAGDQLKRFGAVAIDIERTTGQAVSKTAAVFKDLEGAPLAASVKLNDSLHYLTLTTYEHIRSLEEQGKRAEAARVATDTYADAMASRTKQMISNNGFLETSWYSVGKAVKWTWDQLLGLGRAQTGTEQLAVLKKQLANVEGEKWKYEGGGQSGQEAYEKATANLRRQIQYIERVNGAMTTTAAVQSEQTKLAEKKAAWDKESEKYLTNGERRRREILQSETEGQALLAAGAITAKEYAQRLAEVRDKYKDAKGAVDPFAGILKGIQERTAASKLEAEQDEKLTEGQRLAAKVMEDVRTGTLKLSDAKAVLLSKSLEEMLQAEQLANVRNAARKGSEEAEKERQRYLDTTTKETTVLREAIDKQLDHNAAIGRTEAATAALTAQRELDKASTLEAIAIKRLDRDLDFQAYDLTMAQVKARRELAAAQIQGGILETAQDEIKKSQAAWSKFYDSIYDGLTDSLYRAFEKGAGFFSSLWDGIRNTFKTTVLKVGIQAVVGGTAGAFGLPGAAAAATGTGSGILSGLSNLSSLNTIGSVIGNGFAATVGSSVGSIFGSVAGNTALGSALGLGTSSSLAAASAASVAGGGAAAGAGLTSAASVLGAIPGVGWAALAAVAVASIFGGSMGRGAKEVTATGIEGTFGAGGFAGNRFSEWQQDGGWFHGDRDGKDVSGLDAATAKQFADAYAAVQAAAATTVTALGISADGIAAYSEAISVKLTGDAAKDQEIITKVFADLGDHMASAVAPGLYVYRKEGEAASATLQRLSTSLTTANTWLNLLDQNLLAISLADGDAASQLVDALGGLEQLASKSQAYYDLFFSDAEKMEKTRQGLAASLAAVNLQLPTSKEGFRALAESLDLNTAAGRAAYATLLTVAPQFASMMEAAGQAASDAAAKLLKDVTSAAVVDFAALAAALQGADVATFAETVGSVFDGLASRIKAVLDDIASERQSVKQAVAQISAPVGMTKAEIEAAIASVSISGPNNGALVAAQTALRLADSDVAGRSASLAQAKAMAPDRGTLDAAAANLGNAANATASAQAWVDRYLTDWSGKFAKWVDDAMAGNFDNGLPDSGERNAQNTVRTLQAAQQQQLLAQAAYDSALAAYKSNMATAQQPVAQQQTALAAAVQLQADAVAAARAAQLAYISSLQDFTVDAAASATKLGQLREETLKYYEAQKQLADLMTTSAAGLREVVRTTRMGQLDGAQSLAQRQADFASAYSMALTTQGATKAGYADKLAASLPDLSAALMSTASTRSEWALATARLLAQSSTIADQLEATAPVDYQSESLVLLEAIDGTLAALQAASLSAEQIISDAVDAGSEKTAAGLRAVIAALTGQSIPAFAAGGDHTGGWRIVGERGRELEATGPSKIFNAAQTRQILGGSSGSSVDIAPLIAEIRALRDQVDALRYEARATALNTGKSARILDRVSKGGEALQTVAESA